MFSFFEKLINAYPSTVPQQPPNTIPAFFWHYARQEGVWKVLALMTVSVAVLAVVEVALFGFLGNIVDWLSQSDRETFLQEEGSKLLLMMVVALLVIPGLALLDSLLLHQSILGNFGMIMRWDMHRYLLRQSMSFFSNEFAGRVATKVMQTSLAVRDATVTMLNVMVFVNVYFFGSLILVASFHWMLVLPFIAWLVLYGILLRFILPKMAAVAKRQADARSLMTGRVVDSYTNISTVKLFAHTDREEEYARDAMDGFLQTVYPQMRLSTSFEFIVQLLNGLLLSAAGGIGIWLWMNEMSGVGAVAVAMGLVLRMNGMAHWVMWELARLFESLGVVQDGMNMLSKAQLVTDKPGAGELDADGKPIVFKNIRFAYGGDGKVMDNLSLEIAPGEKIGLVGRSGAGKTTLTNILLRFYDIEGGSVKIGGVSIDDVKQDSLRENIGMVTQDTSLLHRTIRENISYSRPNSSDAEIVEAAKKANAWEFIQQLVDVHGNRGLDAQVGERGVKLSGGQRQRIAIARIFLKDAPILVLDEATSALDSEVEAAIQESLFALMEGKTVIAIAHRLSTIAQLDRLVVMDEGTIVESGTHDELVAKQGIYADLWSRQSGGFISCQPVDSSAAE
ncbi:MAG: ABC transporter ATP-binding protein [Rhizobiaceae bacterium]|nr:ABC transporter ATP-binding protein [Rhizobiaceae bacterium]